MVVDSAQMDNYDPEQVRLMEEMCIAVDEQDHVIGPISKKDAHRSENIEAGKALHRAFSVFIFDDQNRLMLQQRASEKITFPDYWTNTCCSHPLYFPEEMETDNVIGVRRAAQRKLEHELGIPRSEIDLNEFHYLTRILYKAPSCGAWGEHEVDYILILKKNSISTNINPNEVQAIRYVDQNELKDLFKQAESGNVKLTPWFRLICENFLYGWWDNLHKVETMKDLQTVHKMY